jgi:phage gp16-like protein
VTEPDYYVEAWKILSEVARRGFDCERTDMQIFSRSELEAEVASLLRKIQIAKDK